MAIEFSCPACGGTLRVEDNATGGLIRCGGCMTLLRVPDATSPSPPAPESEPRPHPDDSLPTDEPRPRRRRRRGPPPSKGRGPVFWILMAFGLIAVGSCACCGGVFLLLPQPNWRTHQSAQGGFKVDLPATPRNNPQLRGVKPELNMKVEGVLLWSRGEEYSVAYADILQRNQRRDQDEKLLDESVKEIESSPECRRVVRNERLTVSGFPARELELVGKDGGTYVLRMVVADSRYYMVIGGGRSVRPGNENVRRFLNSFEVTDPKLRPAPKPKQWADDDD